MTLYMIGLGLSDKKDITIKGLEAIKGCDYVYLEHYTSIFPNTNVSDLEDFYGKKIILASRNLVESQAEEILNHAKTDNVSFLVIGDVFGATTHTDLFLRAKKENISVKIINNASIMNAIGNTGLELYKFGKTTSMVFFDDNWKPSTPYLALNDNLQTGLHTLVLLDIKVAEPKKSDILNQKQSALPPRFMTINQCLVQFLELEHTHKLGIISNETKVVGIARLGSDNEKIVYGTLGQLLEYDFGAPIHCLIIPGKMHFMEEEALNLYKI